jgi:hypothetical protein
MALLVCTSVDGDHSCDARLEPALDEVVDRGVGARGEPSVDLGDQIRELPLRRALAAVDGLRRPTACVR